jgi:CRP-like cAMP-binding protein
MHNGHAALMSALQELAWPSKAAADLAGGAHVVPYEKDSIIFHAGEAADLVYVLISGEAKLQYSADDGASLLVSIARGGDMLGMFAPDLGPPSKVRPEQLFTAQALSRCTVAIIPTARFAHGLQQLPAEQLVRVLMRGREDWIRLCRRSFDYLTMSIRRRLTHALAEIAAHFGLSDAHGRLITLRLSHEELAALVGASRPMVSKHLKELENEGVLTRERGRYRMLLPLGTPAAGALDSREDKPDESAPAGRRATKHVGQSSRRTPGGDAPDAVRVRTGERLQSM